MIDYHAVEEQMKTAAQVRNLVQEGTPPAGLYDYSRLEGVLAMIQDEAPAGSDAPEGDYVPSPAGQGDEAEAVDWTTPAAQGQPCGDREAGHILVVDDEPEVLEMACSALEMRGYTVTFCRNGREALEYYQQHAAEVDLVISDVVMPEMNGGELLTKLRSADPDAKIMLMSGYCTETTAAALLEKGAAAFVPKPFTLDDFWERVEAAMGCKSRSA